MDYFLFDFSGVQFHYTMSHIKIQQKSLAVWTYCKAFLRFDELSVCSPALGDAG